MIQLVLQGAFCSKIPPLAGVLVCVHLFGSTGPHVCPPVKVPRECTKSGTLHYLPLVHHRPPKPGRQILEKTTRGYVSCCADLCGHDLVLATNGRKYQSRGEKSCYKPCRSSVELAEAKILATNEFCPQHADQIQEISSSLLPQFLFFFLNIILLEYN